MGVVSQVSAARTSASRRVSPRLLTSSHPEGRGFLSIYFRELGGVPFEVATVGPGFTIDQSHNELARISRSPIG